MKPDLASPVIARIPIMPFGMVNAFALIGPEKVVLVDAGLPDTVPRFDDVLGRHDRALSDVSLIVVTHGHIDHAGGACQLREATGAPIVAHRAELPYLGGAQPPPFCPTGAFGRLFLRTGAPRAPWRHFEPEIQLEDEPLDLTDFGVEGRVEATPGHTPGSLSVRTPAGAALVGDMLASGVLLGGLFMTGRPKRPPFEERPDIVAREIERLASEGATDFYLGHGGPLPAQKALQHAQRLRSLTR